MKAISALTLFIFSASAAQACELMPEPAALLSEVDLNGKGYATLQDYELANRVSSFEKLDTDKDGKVTVEEIDKDQQRYYEHCRRVQSQ